MKFDTPATTNPIDQLRIVGKPTRRIDGGLKTTGTAPHADERHDAVKDPAYGVVVGSAIAKGRIVSMDQRAAKAAPGVLAIVTQRNAGKLGKGEKNTAKLLGGPEIEHYHQAVAIVVATTFEQARDAAMQLRIGYERTPGDFDAAFAAAPVQLDATYTTPDHSHSMMEPHASIATWNGDHLTLWTSNQMIAWGVGDVAKTLGLPKAKVRLVSPFIGGGFGGKLFVRSDAIMAALGARAVGRPVKIALARPLIPNNGTHRPATIQRMRRWASTRRA
jgi:xanthine dehydrogenase YagR molybdenum-binding subunit